MRCGLLLIGIWCHFLLSAQTDTGRQDPLQALSSVSHADSLKRTGLNDSLAQTPVKKSKAKKPDTAYYSPKKAALWALGFPGLGQVYNKKYWKLPIVYGLMGGALYFVSSQAIKLRQYNGYIVTRENGGQDPFYNILTLDELVTERDYYRRNVQVASFATMLVWGLTIVDATVDAHMRSFDVSDNLSLQVKPKVGAWQQDRLYAGINLNFKIK